MKVLCTGSRKWTDRKIIHAALEHLTEDDVLVHGANGYYDSQKREWWGADILCDQFAAVHSIPRRPYPVSHEEWREIGLSAGPRRNQHMYDEERPEQVIAFRLYGTSSGTDGMIRIALAGGTPIHVYFLRQDGVLTEWMPTSWQRHLDLLSRNT
jgi:hypothetical protein